MTADADQAPLLQALDCYRSGALDDAERICDGVLAVTPDNFDALNLLGLVYLGAHRASLAVETFDKAASVSPDNPGVYNNLGMALRATQRAEEALAAYTKAVALQPRYAAAHANRGNAFMDLGRPAEAIDCYDAALRLRRDHPDTLVQRGCAFQKLNQHRDAIDCFERAIEVQPDQALAYERLGISQSKLRLSKEAIESFEQARRLAPDRAGLSGLILREKTKICDWQGFEQERQTIEMAIADGTLAAMPFAVLGVSNDPAIQRRAAELRIASMNDHTAATVGRTVQHDRIHLGFFSADFHRHAMMHLAAEVIARLDHERFRLTAFSYSRTRDEYTEAVLGTFDEVVAIGRMSDLQSATLARQKGIDIALDLQGHTRGARPGIFLCRAAPIQVHYLGYPGTIGSSAIDYLVADPTIIPAELAEHYTEKIAYLPNSYQPRDTRIAIPAQPERSVYGLPDEAFVFCCFNNTYKITPEVFGSWMRIMHQVRGSILWLLHDVPEAIENLRREAAGHGINPDRIVFADREPLPRHLARHRLADLFLDTLPYNAHTTASDALLAGLPVLTRIGTTFAGRVAASLLGAIGLPELITRTASEYEDAAVHLARHPDQLAALRNKLNRNSTTHPLFDMAAYTRDLEALFEAMHERRMAGLPPEHIRLR